MRTLLHLCSHSVNLFTCRTSLPAGKCGSVRSSPRCKIGPSRCEVANGRGKILGSFLTLYPFRGANCLLRLPLNWNGLLKMQAL